MWFESLAKALAAGLSIWEHKEKTKVQRELYELRRKHWNESNKARPNMAVLDNLEFELRNLVESFYAATIGKSAPSGMPGQTGPLL